MVDNQGIDRTNVVCGAFFIVCGLVFGYQSLNVDLGTWLRIGPGGLPLALSGLLVLLGGIILVSALREPGEGVGIIAWRGIVFILVSPLVFGLTVRGLGFVPAVFVTALIASFASYRMSVWMALALSFALAVFALVVFSYGLGLPFQRFGPWLPFL